MGNFLYEFITVIKSNKHLTDYPTYAMFKLTLEGGVKDGYLL